MARTKATAGKSIRKAVSGTIQLGISPMLTGSAARQTVIRRSVSLDRDVDALAHELVGEANFSSFVNDAMREKAQQIQMTRLLDELDADFGEIDDATKEKADELWRTASRSTRARSSS